MCISCSPVANCSLIYIFIISNNLDDWLQHKWIHFQKVNGNCGKKNEQNDHQLLLYVMACIHKLIDPILNEFLWTDAVIFIYFQYKRYEEI